MKTNLSSLMNVVAEEERKFAEYGGNVNEYAYNTTIQELDGKVNVIEDYTEDFKKTFEEYKNTQVRITKIKSIIYEKNNIPVVIEVEQEIKPCGQIYCTEEILKVGEDIIGKENVKVI